MSLQPLTDAELVDLVARCDGSSAAAKAVRS